MLSMLCDQGLESCYRSDLAQEMDAPGLPINDYAVCSTEFTRDGIEKIGHQQQTWMRLPCGWQIVAAQVGLMS